jgi:outer membrane protein OmpA-like peptidoglycan-associated protein
MKTLSIGLLVFICWSTLSAYIYVCKIQGFCYEPASIAMTLDKSKEAIVFDTLPEPVMVKPEIAPKQLVVYYAFDKSDFKADTSTLRNLCEWNTFLHKNPHLMLTIIGHTDATGTENYNLALGNRRALGLQNYFVQHGMSASKSMVESKGELEPIDVNYTSSGRNNNRRTILIINK